jgi:hypothetical protein
MMPIERVKFHLKPLVDQILDQLPPHVFTSNSTTFLDPAFGGGQFLREVVTRLRAAGHSDDNIRSRIYGCEITNFRVKYAQQLGKVVSDNLIKADFLSHDWGTMKFDVIVGNPPYQNGNEVGGARSLWRKFVSKAFELCKDDGYCAMVTPSCPYKSLDLGKWFTEYQTEVVFTDVAKHFPGVGSTFTAWVNHKIPTHKATCYPDLGVHVHLPNRIWDQVYDALTESILTKIQDAKVKHGIICCEQDKGYSSNDLHTKPEKYGAAPSKQRPFKVRHASQIEYCWGSIPTECHYKSKVMMTFSGYPNFKYYSKKDPVSSCYQMSGYVLVPNQTEGKNLISIMNLKVNQFERMITSKGGFTGVDTFKHVNLDRSHAWCDQEYFEVLGLSDQEVQWVLDQTQNKKY